ncbi:hypothetical protein PoB_004776600, partial [Plakobranchus ocellatus]
MMTPLSPASSMNYESLGDRDNADYQDGNMSQNYIGGAPVSESYSNDYSRYGIRGVPKFTTTTALGK